MVRPLRRAVHSAAAVVLGGVLTCIYLFLPEDRWKDTINMPTLAPVLEQRLKDAAGW